MILFEKQLGRKVMAKEFCFAIPQVLFTLAICSLVGCANKEVRSEPQNLETVSERTPSSEAEVPGNEDEDAFRLMFWTDRTEQSLFRKLSQIEEVFYRAQGLTVQFDQLLEKTTRQKKGDQQEFLKKATLAGIYPKLQALQQIGEETNSRLLYFVRRMDEILRDPSADAAAKSKAEAALKYLANYLAQSPLSLRLALSPWAQALSDDRPDIKGFEKAFVRLFVGNYDGLLALSKDPKVKKHLEYLSKRVASKPGYLRQRMEELAKTLTPDLLANLDEERSPQSNDDLNKSKKLQRGHYAFVFEGPVQRTGTEILLTELSSKKIPGAFFLPAVSENDPLMRKMQELGMTVGNGTRTRPELQKTFDDELLREIEESARNLTSSTGSAARLIVLPFGAGITSQRVQGVLKKNQLRIVSSPIPSFSWSESDADRIVARVSQQMQLTKSGNVILNPSAVSARVSAALVGKQNQTNRFVDIKEVLGE
jgi:peptidoglycan/xylan/chitin deacetylase (PgdA/CDA1 family)